MFADPLNPQRANICPLQELHPSGVGPSASFFLILSMWLVY